jgi:hypothetical protein
MTISLTDLPIAVKNYLDTKVTISVDIRPKTGTVINVDEDFSFDISAQNAGFPSGIALKNVAYFIQVTDPTRAKLYVPDKPGATAKSIPHPPMLASTPLTPGTLVDGMCITSTAREGYTVMWAKSDLQNYLAVGDKDTIKDLAGRALATGSFAIKCWITADVDLDFLFPAGEPSVTRQGAATIAE